jgi:hypothetical protein
MMLFRHFSPLSVGRLSQLSAAFGEWPAASSENLADVNLFRSWFLYDSGLRFTASERRTNWNAVMGIGLATIISAGFWTGIGIVVAQFCK